MSLFSWIKRKPENTKGENALKLEITKGGLEFRADKLPEMSAYEWLQDPSLFKNWEPIAILGQLESEGFAVTLDDTVLINWSDLFDALEQPDYSTCANILQLPHQSTLQIKLSTQGSISDRDFQLNLSWQDEFGRQLTDDIQRIGALVIFRSKQMLLTRTYWQLIEEISRFFHRSDDERNQITQEQYWAKIRALAKSANVKLDRYLDKTIVISVNQLEMALRVAEFDETQVVEVYPIIPHVETEQWLSTFDRFTEVQNHYDLKTSQNERIRILIEPDTKTVLQEIKKMPKRRVAGLRAENFLRNPFALLGEAMSKVILPENFEKARDNAGIHLYDFSSFVLREDTGHIRSLNIQLNSRDEFAPKTPLIEIKGRNLAQQFVTEFETALTNGAVCFRWGRSTLEIRGDAEDQLIQLRTWLCDAWFGEPLIAYANIFDLSSYAPRVEAIGIHKPQYAPYLARKDVEGGWLPENLEPIVEFRSKSGDSVLIPVQSSIQDSIKKWLESDSENDFFHSSLPVPISKNEAKQLLNSFKIGIPEIKKKYENKTDTIQNSTEPRKTLAIRQNVDQLDYSEERAKILAFDLNVKPILTTWLKPEIQLKPHQIVGVAWLQNLWIRQDKGVRGALLADDMGLGKTLQILSFIAWYFESYNHTEPAIVIAPVSLLENWQEEINKFFDERLSNTVLALYGKSLKERKVAKVAIDEELKQSKIDGFLRPDWLGSSKLILTTYETLRDLEFSFAKVKWSIMICDEAQKIKTPSALMTHSAKAQNAKFKIACTGTPVENSLTDLWCLFDFIQPGLLQSLSEFCRTYRRPIETKTDEDNQKLEELRKLVDPQVLRRMKSDVADLPKKIIDLECRKLSLTNYQHRLYEQATSNFQNSQKNGSAILGLLHRLRSICADPKDDSLDAEDEFNLNEHCQRSPKLAWLISTLYQIQKSQEKVIIFTEFKDLQRMIQYRIREYFGFCPIIVNGSTKVGNEAGYGSRQSLISSFQKKPGFGIIILSTTAVGFGVNIQAANHVIHFTRAWNPAKEDQATDRAYRIGQQNTVYVYYPTVVSKSFQTFENRLDDLLESKRQLASDMLNGTGEIDITEWGIV